MDEGLNHKMCCIARESKILPRLHFSKFLLGTRVLGLPLATAVSKELRRRRTEFVYRKVRNVYLLFNSDIGSFMLKADREWGRRSYFVIFYFFECFYCWRERGSGGRTERLI